MVLRDAVRRLRGQRTAYRTSTTHDHSPLRLLHVTLFMITTHHEFDPTPVAPEFRTAYEEERRLRLRGRILWYCATMVGIAVARMAGVVILMLFGGDTFALPLPVGIVMISIGAAYACGMGAAYLAAKRSDLDKRQLLQLIWRIVIILGTIDVLFGSVLVNLMTPTGVANILSGSSMPSELLGSLLLLHLVTSLFIPWTPREAARPLVPLLILFAIVTLLSSTPQFSTRVVLVAFAPAVGLPGMLVCWWRHSRFRTAFHLRVLDESWDSMKRELVDARRIHEALFPAPGPRGSSQLTWVYHPMQQIGGDFVFAHFEEEADRLTTVLVDVTGHGIRAALTVNRIHGELERLYAEDPALDPAAALTALNRYFLLTLAEHGIYATAIALRSDPGKARLEWANAGHPDAVALTPDGELSLLKSQTVMLGVTDGPAWTAETDVMDWPSGSRVIACSDGILEARGNDGSMLGPERFAEAVRTAPPDAPQYLLELARRAGYPVTDDDVLIIEVVHNGVPAAVDE